MKLRRRANTHNAAGSILQREHEGAWFDLSEVPDALQWLQRLAPAVPPQAASPLAAGSMLLPLQPLSFRDCMLYEKHWIDSSRGYTRRFMPGAYRVARLFERISGQSFPAFRPNALWRRQPIYYFGNHLTLVAGGGAVRAPSYTRALDFELELGWVLSHPLYNATPQEALQAIGGFVVVNDFSARDVQRAEMASGLGPQKSKHFLSSMSPTLVTADDILPKVDRLSAYVEINGRRVSETSTAHMKYSLAEVLAHLSRDEQLHAGELIASGTLPGGSGMETGHWLRPGDRLRLVIDAIGEIVHDIVA